MKRELIFFKDTQYQLRGMATTLEVRGLGIGKMILQVASKILKEKEIDLLWCNAREEAFVFYKKQDFKVIDTSFKVPKIGIHYKMYKKAIK